MASEGLDARFLEYAESKSVELRNELVLDNRGLALAFARRYRDRGVPTEDLEQVAQESLVSAVERFDPEVGVRFSTFAARTIEGSLKQYFRDRTWDTKVPRSTRQLVVALKSAEDTLTQQLARRPTVQELAEHLGVAADELAFALEAAGGYRTEPLDSPDSLGDDMRPIDAADARVAAPQLLERLPPDERRVVELRFYESLSQTEIAAEVGVSQMQVSRLLRRALERLRSEINT